jgi:hypothetical protein
MIPSDKQKFSFSCGFLDFYKNEESVADQDPELYGSVGDPDPHVFGPPGSVSQRYGSGPFPFLLKVLSGPK